VLIYIFFCHDLKIAALVRLLNRKGTYLCNDWCTPSNFHHFMILFVFQKPISYMLTLSFPDTYCNQNPDKAFWYCNFGMYEIFEYVFLVTIIVSKRKSKVQLLGIRKNGHLERYIPFQHYWLPLVQTVINNIEMRCIVPNDRFGIRVFWWEEVPVHVESVWFWSFLPKESVLEFCTRLKFSKDIILNWSNWELIRSRVKFWAVL